MNNQPPEQPTSRQPAGYDSEGRPLYYNPTTLAEDTRKPTSMVTSKPDAYDGHNFNPKLRTQYANEPDLVHAARPLEPSVPEMSEELKRKHEESVRRYPYLNLSEGEFVILQIKRHPIGLFIPIFVTLIAIIVLSSMALLLPDILDSTQSTIGGGDSALVAGDLVASLLLLMVAVSVILCAASVWVYQKNQFFLTNESVIQQIQLSLFSHHEQTVSLGSIEDASYKRRGILQHIFNYGLMRLSTEGQETTYRFAFVENPKEQIAIVNNAVEAFKNGRPVADID